MLTLLFHLLAYLVLCPTYRNPLRLYTVFYSCAHPQHEGRSQGCPHITKGAVLAGDGGACRMAWPWGCRSEPDCPESILLLGQPCTSISAFLTRTSPKDFSRDVAVQELHLVLTFLIPIPQGGRMDIVKSGS